MSKKKHRRKKRSQPPPAAAQSEKRLAADAGKGLTRAGSERPRSARLWLILAAGAVVIGAGLAYLTIFTGRAPVKRVPQANVLLITLDTTRADRIGCYGYDKAGTPNLDSLAGNGVRFENVYCPVPLTLPSHCSIMTGTYPFSHHVHNNGSYELGPDELTLAEAMKDRGMATAAFVASFSVDSRFGLGQGFDLYDDTFQAGLPFKPLNSERKAEDVASAFLSWLEGHSAEPFFSWVHFFDPHLPYQPPSPYREEFAASPYDGEIAYMDAWIGKIIDGLKKKNLLGRTLIILAGDHGEAFGEKVETGHGVFLYEGTMRVPLIFYAENHLPPGRVIRSRVRLIDIMPSIMDLLGLPAPEGCQGTSLIPYIEGRKKTDLDSYIETFYPRENFGWSELVGLVRENWKYIRAPKPELYNLQSDPGEDDNVFTSAGKVASEMSARLDELIRHGAEIGPGKGRTLTTAEEERLRSLGYTSYAGAKSDYPDPKDKLDLLKAIQRAEGYDFEGRYAEAEALYKELVSVIPDSPASYVNLALSQARQQKFDETIQTLRRGIERIPGSEILLVRLGHTYLVTGRLQEALDTMAEVLKRSPENVDALTVSAGVLDTLGKKEEARTYYERAIAVEPESKYLRVSLAFNLASSGRIGEAIEVYKTLTEEYPGDAVLHQYLGIAYGFQGDYAAAIDSLKQAIYIRPTPTAYFNLAVAYRQTGEIAEAVRYLKMYLENPEGESEQSIRAARAELERLEAGLKK
jgi:arylsulfatase A-like enzyme/tetratricopeptide (TPR) repeat protein